MLAVLDVHLREVLERLVERPVLVHVDLERQVGDAPHRANPLEIETVTSAELELEAPETSFGGRLLCPPRHVVGIAEPDRPRRRRALTPQSQKSVHGQVDELALEVVQRCVDRGAGRELLPRESIEDVVERERIVAESVGLRLEVRERGFRRLVVALDRRRLAESGAAVVLDLDLDDVGLVVRLARDRERLGETKRRDAGAHLHPGNPNVFLGTRSTRAA